MSVEAAPSSDVDAGARWDALDRRASVLAAARAEGLLEAKDKTIGGRVPAPLIEAAKARSSSASDSGLLRHALSKVALEDDFGRKLVACRGTVSRDLELDFG